MRRRARPRSTRRSTRSMPSPSTASATTFRFLSALMQHPRWQAGKLSTGFIAEEFPDGFHPLRRKARWRETLAAVAAAIDHVLGERKRQISGQLTGRAVTRDRRRAVRLGARPDDPWLTLDVGARGRGHRGACRRRRRRCRAGAACWCRPGSRAIRSGPARSTASRSRCRCARSPTASCCRIAASRRGPTSTPSGRPTAARLMPVKKPPDTGKKLLCPMPGLVVSIAVDGGPGGQGRRDARRGRGDEDGERAARRARRHGEDDQGASPATASRSMR